MAILSNEVRAYQVSASFEMTKKASTSSVAIGTPFSYTIDVINTGDTDINDVTITDDFPVGFEVQSITVDGVNTTGNLDVGVSIGALAVMQTKVVVITVVIESAIIISDEIEDYFVNLVNGVGEVITPGETFIVTAFAEDSVGISVYDPKLVLEKSADKTYVVIDDIVTYQIDVTNQEAVGLFNVPLEDVIVSDLLASELSFIAGSVVIDGVAKPEESIIAGIKLGTLQIGETKVIRFKAQVISDKKPTITNVSMGEYRYTLPDGIPGSGRTFFSVMSNPYTLTTYQAEVSLTKTADVEEVGLGDTISYKVEIKNNGNLIAYNVLFKDHLPKEVTLVSDSFKVDGKVKNGVDLEKGVILPFINPGESVYITYQVVVVGTNSCGFITNQAEVTYDYRLPDGTGGTKIVKGEASSSTVMLNITIFKQMSVESYLVIPTLKPDIEVINVASGTVDIINCHVIETPQASSEEGQTLTGYKLIVRGNLDFVIEYTALNEEQSVHSAHYRIPFSTFTILPQYYVIGSKLDISGSVEDVYYSVVDVRNFFTNVTLLINVKLLGCAMK